MSSVIPLSGTYQERQAQRQHASKGLLPCRSLNGASFFYYEGRPRSEKHVDCDVIIVEGKNKVVSVLPEASLETREDLLTKSDSFWTSDFLIKLEKADTYLFTIGAIIPKYHAELGMISAFSGSVLTVCAAVFAIPLAHITGFGSWSFHAALGAAGIMFAWRFLARDYWWMMVAALRGAWYVRRSVLSGVATRATYAELVEHLADCADSDVAAIHRIVRYLI